MEHAKPKWSVELPTKEDSEHWVDLPREKPIPKQKPMTKWERFRIEKGLPMKQKRGRMVFDEKTSEWVPRYGAGSVKKIQDQHNWLMEEKAKHRDAGLDPFTYQKNEKKLDKEK